MSRPENTADLPDSLLATVEVARIDLNDLYANGGADALMAAKDFIEAAAASGLNVDRYKGRVERFLTSIEKESKLADAQKSWDRYKDLYDQAIEDPLAVQDWQRGLVDQWVKGEGLVPINWAVTA